MKTVIKTTAGVATMTLVVGADEAGAIEKWKLANPGKYISHREMPDAAIPTDRTFRNAWADVTPELVIDIDMPKAREIHKEHLRQIRAPLLAALDVEYQRADEQNNAALKAQIAAKKQALRDVTKHASITAATTPEELKAAALAALK